MAARRLAPPEIRQQCVELTASLFARRAGLDADRLGRASNHVAESVVAVVAAVLAVRLDEAHHVGASGWRLCPRAADFAFDRGDRHLPTRVRVDHRLDGVRDPLGQHAHMFADLAAQGKAWYLLDMSRDAAKRNPVDRYGMLVAEPIFDIDIGEVLPAFVEDRSDRIGEALGISIGDMFGCGAFGCTYELTDQPGWMLKVTSDEDEGRMWQKLWSLQKKGEQLDGIPVIHRLVRLKTDYPVAAELELYAVIREEVQPVLHLRSDNWHKLKIAQEDYDEVLDALQLYATAASAYYFARVQDSEQVEDIKNETLEAAKKLRKAHPLARPLSLTLTRLANLDIPPRDIGAHNLGVREKTFEGRPKSLVFFDPGVTKGGEEVELEMVANAESWASIVAESDIPSELIEEVVVEESAMKVNPNKPFFLVVAEPDGEYMLDVEFDSCDRASRAATNLVKAYPEIVQVRIVQEGLEENPPPGPPPRRWRPAPEATTRERMERLVREHEAEERPFDPEQPPSWRGSARDLSINARRKLIYRVRGTADRYQDRYKDFTHSSSAVSMDLDDKKHALQSAEDFVQTHKPEGDRARVWVEEHHAPSGASRTIARWTGDHMRGTWSGGER